MTARPRIPSLLLLALLAGCGPRVDNPNNLPRLGRWERESKLIALVSNDVWVDRDKAPFTLPPDSRDETACIEPALRSRDEVNSDLLANSQSICRLDTLDSTGGRITATGRCGPVDRMGATITGTIEFTGTEAEDHAEAIASVQLLGRGRAGASERMRIAYQTRWRRLGDCTR